MIRDDRTFLRAMLALAGITWTIVWSIKGGFHYPDEIFQYLEPANLRLTGTGWLPWEFDRGVRNWLLPIFYGGLIWWGHLFDLDGLTIQRLLGLHNVLWSLLLIPAVYRLAAALGDRTAARLAVVVTAVYMPIAFYLPHTLNEVPGLLLTTWGLAWFCQSQTDNRFTGRPLVAGLVLGIAVVVRPTLGLWTVVPALVWALRLRWKSFAGYAAGGLLAVTAGGLIDLVTWGGFLSSTLEYIQYNLIESGASDHGVSPWDHYLVVWFWERLGVGGAMLLLASLYPIRRTFLVLLAAIIPLVALSAIGHKEERFLLSSYPLIIACGAAGISAIAARLRTKTARGLLVGFALVVIMTGFVGMQSQDWRWRAGVFRGQSYVGMQTDATGILLDDRIHLNGGYLILDRNIPQSPFRPALARHRLFNYLVLQTDSQDAVWAERNTFESVAEFDEMTVYRRSE
jgi:hypothetical protein